MPDDGLPWLTATSIQRQVAAGALDPSAVIASLLERITRMDGRTHAFVHVDRAAAPGAGPLAGVGLAVKDSQPVAGMPWTFGAARWRDRVAVRDSIQVADARAAGAAILGKTNTPELAASIGTVNEIFPATENPWRPGLTPGGSSGGSAAAVAAGLCTVAFGDDMGGSIRFPAACNGVFGLRPTTGTVAHEAPEPTRLSVRGPLARSAADLRLLYELMSGRRLGRGGARLRIAVVDETALGMSPEVRAAVARAAAALAGEGHALSRFAGWDAAPVAEAYRVVRPASLASEPGAISEYGAAVRPLIERGRQLSAAEYLAARAAGEAAAAPLLAALAGGVDAFLTPTLGLVPMDISAVPRFLGEGYDRYTQFMLPVSFAGLPAVSVPAGLAAGVPVGVQLAGRPFGEADLLALAEELQGLDGFGFRPPPEPGP